MTFQSHHASTANRGSIGVMFFFLATFMFCGCREKASSEEIEKMCHHLTELRNARDDTQMLQDCIEEAHLESVSKKQALCRINAVNKQEYWIRCRTGEPRPPQ